MANLIQVKAMCTAMVQRNMEVILSLPGKKYGPEFTQNEIFHIDIRKPIISSKLDKYINRQSVIKSVNKYDPDIIYLRIPLLLHQVKYLKKNIIIELHNNKLHSKFRLLNNYWSRMIVRMAKTDQILKVVCISEALGKFWLSQGIPAEKVIVEHDGIDPSLFKHKNALDARIALNLPLDKKIVTYSGRLYKNRKIENILALAKQFKEVIFLIVGGPEEQKVIYSNKAKNEDIKNIIFTGQISHDKVPLYLYASDILLGLWSSDVPTINFCSPLKIFEYMASGRIIVAHGFPTIKEVLIDGQNSILVKPDSIDDLISKVQTALNMDYPSDIAEKALKDVNEKYTWYKRIQSIFSSLEK
ncbi:MAG: glycosyltransferase [Acholeplasma sp.]|nr:glycosyltransferase [Acholeplasma sp.]